MLTAIPDIKEPETFTKIQPADSPFVHLVDGEDFDVKMQYPLLKLNNVVTECYVRYEVAERLKIAQNYLPCGIKLRIWDAWRPFALQEELYKKYSDDIIKKFDLGNKPKELRDKIITGYISYPQKDKNFPAVHTSGGAVDVTLVDKNGNELKMGTDFDAFCEQTTTNYYENTDEDIVVRNNRRMLYNCMTSAGFTSIPSEWWHYDFGDRFWSYYNNTPAIYSGVFEKENLHFYNAKTE